MPPLQEVNVANCLELELAVMAKASEGAHEEEGMTALRRTRLVRPKLHILGFELQTMQFLDGFSQAVYIIVYFKGIINC